MEIGVVEQIDINHRMQDAYLSYAMSVIVARALPDARDGLKPVHRRILYAMHDMGLRPASEYKKSARIVGEVLGKYHPHGDAAVYEAMARMAQDFSLRYPLVDGQGNFGSVDGDSPAAMRYTEARMAALSGELLTDIDKATVDFVPNFDDTLKEPSVLPATLPNLLVNGTSGIAVGMATSVPPHNLGEVCDALVYVLDNWKKQDDISVEDLMRFVQGPDFPTGGVVYRRVREEDEDAIVQAYAQGRSKLTVRARAHVEEMSRNRHRIVVTELPYQVNKSSLVERIAELVRDGRIEGITDLRDESDRRGMRLVIETTRTVEPAEVLAQLFKYTPLESTFSVIMLALVDGEPRLLSLKKALQTFLDHRIVIVTRRTQHDLARARQRAHILEGLLIALDNLDEVIDTIRRSQTTDTARTNLRRKFKLSEEQANAILDMPLKRLAALERKKLQEEYKETVQLIKHLEGLLKNPTKLRGVIRTELLTLKERYADARRTQIVDLARIQLAGEELPPDEPVWVALTAAGRLARQADAGDFPKLPARVVEPPAALAQASTRDTLYLFDARGEAVAYPVHQLPEGAAWEGAGAHYADLTALSKQAPAVTMLALPSRRPSYDGSDGGEDAQAGQNGGFLTLATRGGQVKRVALADLPAAAGQGFTVMGVGDGDALIGVQVTSGQDELLLVTAAGKSIRFKEDDVRPMGLPAGGVAGVKLGGKDDAVVALAVVRPRSDLLVVSSDGKGKRCALGEYPTQGRAGSGVITAKFANAKVRLVGAAVVQAGDPLVLVSERGAVRTIRARSAPRMERVAQGDSVATVRDKDRLACLVVPNERPGGS